MKILVAGLGSIGKRHIKNLLFLGVEDIIIYRRQNVKDEESDFPIFTDLDEALAQKPEAILICNPTTLHIPIAIKAAKAGVNIFMEKPLSSGLEGIDELIKIIREKKIVSMVGYQFRFHPALQKIKELIGCGILGRIIFGRAEVGQYMPDWHPDEDYHKSYAGRKELGGGAILTLIHELDYLTWLLGEPESVSCVAGQYSDLDVDTEDLAEIIINYKKNIIGQCHLDYIQKSPSRWLKIIGEKGEIFWDYFENEVRLFDGAWKIIYSDKEFKRNDMFLKEMKYFLKCVKEEAASIVDIEADLPVFKLALASKLSSKEKKTIEL